MAQERDPLYPNDGTNRTVYTRESNSTGWFVGIVVAIALLGIAYLVFSANTQPTTTNLDINTPPAVTVTPPADTLPMTPVTPSAEPTPMTPVTPGTDTNPIEPAPNTPAPATPAPSP